MEAYQKLEYLQDVLGKERLLDSIFEWFPTARIEECLDDIANDWDVDFYVDRDE